MTQVVTVEFLEEVRRVIGLDAAETDFFGWSVAPSDEQLREATAWLRSLPAGLGEQGLESRAREKFGPPGE